jgi:radical SAM protein with 4Fe4S-binding SPASM domain
MKDTINFLKTISLRKILNLVLLTISYGLTIATKKYIHWGKPAHIAIEPTSNCNLGCTECPSGNNSLTRRRGNITFDTFKTTIDELQNYTLTCTLYFQGEPFLNPQLFRMLAYLKKKKIYSIISTNAHFLSKENCIKLIESGVSRVIISLDAINQKDYSSYRVGGSLDKVIKGTRQFISERKKARKTYPTVILQSLIFRFNDNKISEIKDLSKELKVDKLWLKAPQFYDINNAKKLMSTNPKFARYTISNNHLKLKGKVRNKCWRSWSNPVITVDGDILPCCFDKDANYKIGNIKQEFVSAWRSEKISNFRKQIVTGRDKIDICSNCTEGVKYLLRK